MADPVGADLLGGHPRQVPADPLPQVVVTAAGNRPPIAVAQQLPAWRRVPFLASIVLVGIGLYVRLRVEDAEVVAVIGGEGDPREWWAAIRELAGPAGGGP